MSEQKDVARLAAEAIRVWNPDWNDHAVVIASDEIRKHFPPAVAIPVSGEILTPRTDAAYQDALECEIKDDVVPYAFARQLERELAEAQKELAKWKP